MRANSQKQAVIGSQDSRHNARHGVKISLNLRVM